MRRIVVCWQHLERNGVRLRPLPRVAGKSVQEEREQLTAEPLLLIGQSLGGQTALLTAARHPELIRGLVLADAGPPKAVKRGRRRLLRWAFAAAEAWADGLEERDGGWWPSFDPNVIMRTLRDAAAHAYWTQWEAISCPTMVVRAGKGALSQSEPRGMADRLPHARVVELPDAAHDLHLDRPSEWRRVVSDFLDELA